MRDSQRNWGLLFFVLLLLAHSAAFAQITVRPPSFTLTVKTEFKIEGLDLESQSPVIYKAMVDEKTVAFRCFPKDLQTSLILPDSGHKKS